MSYVDEDRCAELGLDPKRVASIARRLSHAAEDARKLRLVVFGGSGSGSLRRVASDYTTAVAELDGPFDGGDGGDTPNPLQNRMP